MRLATKSTLALFLVYAILLGGLTLWLQLQLRAMAGTLMEGTARLVGNEIAAAMSESALDQLQHADPGAHQRLEQLVDDLTEHSDVLSSLAVVDESGKVVVSDDIETGHQLAPPQLVFQGQRRAQFLSSSNPLDGGKYHLFVPLIRQDDVAGYLRLSISSYRIAKLYTQAGRQLLLGAGAGLILLAGFAMLFHAQLTRRGAALTRSLEAALGGETAAPLGRGDELAPVLDSARRLGTELRYAREQCTAAQRRFDALAQVIDVGLLFVGRDCALDFANQPARELLGCRAPGELERRWDDIRAVLQAALARAVDGARTDVEVPTAGRPSRVRLECYRRDGDDQEGYLILVRSRDTVIALDSRRTA